MLRKNILYTYYFKLMVQQNNIMVQNNFFIDHFKNQTCLVLNLILAIYFRFYNSVHYNKTQ